LSKLTQRIIVGLVLGVAVLVTMGIYADGQKLLSSLHKFQWPLLIPVLALTLFNYLLRFIKWHYYLRLVDVKVGLVDSFLVFMSGLSMAVTPGKFGELLKAVLLKERTGVSASPVASVVVAERLTDVIALLFLCAGGAVSSQYGYEVLAVTMAGCIVFVAIIASERASMAIIELIGQLPVGERIAPKLEEMYRAMALLIRPTPLLLATVLSVAAWVCECVGFHLVLTGLPDTDSTIAQATFIYAFATIFGAVTMLPGGLGVTEGSLIGMTDQVFNLASKAGATAGAMVIRFCTLWFAVAIGFVALFFCRRGKSSFTELVQPSETLTERAAAEDNSPPS